MNIDFICASCIEALQQAGYNESTIFNYHGVVRRFKTSCNENGVNDYTPESGKMYANDVISKKTGEFSQNRYHTQGRFIRLLDSYFITRHFDFSVITRGKIQPNNEKHKIIYSEYCAHLKQKYEYVLRKRLPGRQYVFPAMYRFLYCCGVRCGEARKLKCEDVHLDKGYIDIMQSKAHRDRRLYLSQELIDYLKVYECAISKVFPLREYFFPGGHSDICSPTALSSNFRNIWTSAGLKRDGKVKSRAYDFRHHFACANLMRWSKEGKDVHAMLPYLMRYMGHSSLESTYYYIHLIPDFFPQYNVLVSSTEDLIPEVEEYEV